MSQENLEIVRGVYEAANRGDIDSVSSHIHPDIEFHTYAQSPEAGVYRGKDAVQKYNENLFDQFESLRIELDELVDSGESVVVMSTQHAVPKGAREEMTVQVIEVWTLRDGMLAQRRSYATRDEGLKAAGLGTT